MEQGKRVLAMYDVRGIQSYIYKTTKVQDAIGASKIVEDIIEDALYTSVEKIMDEKKECGETITTELDWCDSENDTTKPYEDENADIQVLYIGGGNAFVGFRDRKLCLEINRKMSKYVLEHTYSLQLAIAITDKSDNYANDYSNIFSEMVRIKAHMEQSVPLGTLPVMDIENKSGLPQSNDIPGGLEIIQNVSRETYLKKLAEKKDEKRYTKAKEFDCYIEQKGDDSILAVVHMDGNNMGLRIRSLISGINDYKKAVTEMRNISWQISNSYKTAYEEMEKHFNKDDANNVLKILVAGDDITYVCKGKYAIATVEYLSRAVSQKTMNGKDDPLSRDIYGFSVCAGIAYIHSHFPFSIGYEVAEGCCDSAKTQAKKIENQLIVNDDKGNEYYKVGNWFDYQICKNVQTENLNATREREYVTKSGENLLIRPYELPLLNLADRKDAKDKIENLKANIAFFQKSKTKEPPDYTDEQKDKERPLPRSHAKALRNYYSEGKSQMDSFAAFLKSRQWTMPDGTLDMYYESDGRLQAKWYDAIELIDCYESLESVEGSEKE